MGNGNLKKLDRLLDQWLHYPGDEEEIRLSKKIMAYIAGSTSLLSIIAAIVYLFLGYSLMAFIMVLFGAAVLGILWAFSRIKRHTEEFFLGLEAFKILFSFFGVVVTGGILRSGGIVFIGMAGLFFALVFPNPQKVRYLLMLYLGTLVVETVLQSWLKPLVQFSDSHNLILFALYLILSVLTMYSFVRIFVGERIRFRQIEAEKLRALDAARSRFFTNISHEFRTPLTVILGMADEMREVPFESIGASANLIRRNGKKLLRLVSQLLDLSKLEAGDLSAHYVQDDMAIELKYLLESFQSLAETKNISLHFSSDPDEIWMDFDPEKLDHLVGNLLDNAVKYTPYGGTVTLTASTGPAPDLPASSEFKTENYLKISVKDTGIGIPAQHLERIFDRYYQIGEWRVGGAGIGLSLAKEYARLLGGYIEVDSRPGEGSAFSVFLPVSNNAPLRAVSGSENLPEAALVHAEMPAGEKPANGSRLRLLIIEDNPDVIRYLQNFLREGYDIDTALDGEQGISLALERMPDIIISDIMMPKKDGLEVCRALKSDFRTNHIPIVLLTAKTDMDSRIAGLETGADSYLAKPFNRRELEVELKKLTTLREMLKRKFGRSFAQPLPAGPPKGLNERFLYDVRQCLERHYEEEEFGITALCSLIGVSRTQLHRKLIALTGLSASYFIRSYRLEKARELLLTTRMTVAEVAYAVGFKDSYYFSRTFSEEFGVSPSGARGGFRGARGGSESDE